MKKEKQAHFWFGFLIGFLTGVTLLAYMI